MHPPPPPPAPVFTEADLAWDPTSPPVPHARAPPTHLDLTQVTTAIDDFETEDILADLEAVSTPLRAVQNQSLSSLAFAHLPRTDPHAALSAHLRRANGPAAANLPATLNPSSHLYAAPGLAPCKAEMASPTDIAATAAAWRFGNHISSPVPPAWGDPDTIAKTESVVCGVQASGLSLVSPGEDVKREAFLDGVPNGAVRKPRARRGRKRSLPVPSRFCHICARTQKSRKMYCANLQTEMKCRKSVCEPCFVELGWDFAQCPANWLCPHCRGICNVVPRARCHIYTKTNEKRKAARRL